SNWRVERTDDARSGADDARLRHERVSPLYGSHWYPSANRRDGSSSGERRWHHGSDRSVPLDAESDRRKSFTGIVDALKVERASCIRHAAFTTASYDPVLDSPSGGTFSRRVLHCLPVPSHFVLSIL